MKISVAMCTYNGSKHVIEQLESIVHQTQKVDEIVICDDCSSDDTVKIVDAYLHNKQIDYKIINNQANLGFIKNFHQVISKCTGDIIFFADQDDTWNLEKVKKIGAVFEKDKQALLVFSDGNITDENLIYQKKLLASLQYQSDFLKDKYIAFERLIADNYVTGAAAAIRRELLNLAQPFSQVTAHDYWFAVIAALYDGLRCVDEPLFNYRQHESNTIGINKRINLKKIIDLFNKELDENNKQNLYAEIRLPILDDIAIKIKQDNLEEKFVKALYKEIDFWKDREKFPINSMVQNMVVVIKDMLKGKQRQYRNVKKPVIKDAVKAIALANRDKK
jgi:Glycosyltransferases involved in cell wall biogenesis